MSNSPPRRLSGGTRDRLAACGALGLSYWSDHPADRTRETYTVWAIDGRQQAHVVRVDREAGTVQHVCGSVDPVAVQQCVGSDEVVPYTIPEEQQQLFSNENGYPRALVELGKET